MGNGKRSLVPGVGSYSVLIRLRRRHVLKRNSVTNISTLFEILKPIVIAYLGE